MNQTKMRADDYEARRRHLQEMTDEQLKARFWMLAEQTIDPLINLAKTHTTPSIERSVLLRMGFSSLEAKTLVDKTIEYKLIGKGAGNVVFRLARIDATDVRTAGLKLIKDDGWNRLQTEFGVKA
jgi:D-ornithine 4,5-aminomutase subunit alpha